jgi:putative ABC transport system permease protein
VTRFVLVRRLALRDLRRRPAEAALLLLVIMAASAALTLGLVLNGVTSNPYQRTREATAGPDAVGGFLNLPPGPSLTAGLASLEALARVPGVTGHGGPYPVTWAVIRAHGVTAGVMAEGRDPAPASVDQPEVTQGSWVRGGGVVVERSLAEALGVGVGDPVTMNGRPFKVTGIAVTAADAPYPYASFSIRGGPYADPGLVWLTRAAARSFATSALPLSYIMNLKLADPAAATAFANAHGNSGSSIVSVVSWQQISQEDARLIGNEQVILSVGSWLLSLLAVASVAVLVGGRMAEQKRRVGLLKAVGGTPGLVAVVLLAEHLALALVAAAAGLAAGWLAAPLLTSPGAGLIGSAGPPSLTLPTVGLVVAVAVIVASAATLVPAIRAARTSTVSALADAPRAPRRSSRLIAASARLPVPLLLGMRLAGRRPRRIVLGICSTAITVTMIVAALTAHAHNAQALEGFTANNPRYERVDEVLLVITIMLIAMAAVNAIFIAWSTVLDSRHSSALARALGATPAQMAAALSAAQALPALAGAVIGVPCGIALYTALKHQSTALPSAWWILAVVLGTLVTVTGLTVIPARIGAHSPVAEILQSETA